MYYHNQYQGNSILSSSERNRFLRGNGTRDSGLILSTDAKPRLKWTQDLHERFVEAVNQLGGGDKATPKTIMNVMSIPGLTLYHLKSHLQKYRLSKNLKGQANISLNKTSVMNMEEENIPEADTSHSESLSIGPQPSMNSPISDALQMQIEVQRRLHEQLEVQRHLQHRIEAQGKYLQTILEKAQETLGRQNIGQDGIEATKAQLSELTSKVPNFSLESCLTLSEGTKKAPKMFESRLGLIEEPFFHRVELTWAAEDEEGLRENKRPYLSTMVNDTKPRTSSSRRSNENGEDFKLETRTRTELLDLNIHDENYGKTRPKQFDLNGFKLELRRD